MIYYMCQRDIYIYLLPIIIYAAMEFSYLVIVFTMLDLNTKYIKFNSMAHTSCVTGC